MVPVLERAEMEAALQAAKLEHATLPPLRLGITLPTLRFFISPARLHRVMRILRAALPGALPSVLSFRSCMSGSFRGVAVGASPAGRPANMSMKCVAALPESFPAGWPWHLACARTEPARTQP